MFRVSVTPVGFTRFMSCTYYQSFSIAFSAMYTSRTRQNFNVLRHFSSDTAKLLIFGDVHTISSVKKSYTQNLQYRLPKHFVHIYGQCFCPMEFITRLNSSRRVMTSSNERCSPNTILMVVFL